MKKIIAAGKFLVRTFLALTPQGRAYYARRQEAQRKECSRVLLERGPDILRKVHEAFNKEAITYFVTDGTLLGVIREGGILKHDIDIDFAIPPNAVTPKRVLEIAESLGFEFFWAWTYDGKVSTMAFNYQDVHVDFDFLEVGDSAGKETWRQIWFTKLDGVKYEKGDRAWSAVCLPPRPCVRTVVTRKLTECDVVVSVPENCDEYLTAEYGLWRQPDPQFRERNVGRVSQGRKILPLPGVRISRQKILEMM